MLSPKKELLALTSSFTGRKKLMPCDASSWSINKKPDFATAPHTLSTRHVVSQYKGGNKIRNRRPNLATETDVGIQNKSEDHTFTHNKAEDHALTEGSTQGLSAISALHDVATVGIHAGVWPRIRRASRE